MASEDKIDIPDTWRQLLHPRRHGVIGLGQGTADLEPARDGAGHPGRHPGWGAELADEHERILRNSRLGPALARLVRSGHPDVAADAVRLALAPVPARGRDSGELSVEQVDELIACRGLAHAAAAFVESCAYKLEYAWTRDGQIQAVSLRPFRGGGDYWAWIPRWQPDVARHLRSLLAAAPRRVYDEAVAALTPLRGGPVRPRVAASYLMPDQRDWVSADLADMPADYPCMWLFFSAATAEQLSQFPAGDLEDFVTAYDAIGPEAVPLIAQWLARGRWTPNIRRDALEVLTRIPTDAAFEAMFRLIDVPGVASGILTAAERFPRRAARMLAARRETDPIGVLFYRHVRAHPDVPEAALVPRAPDAPADAVPRLLVSPPWTRKPPARTTVSPSPLAAGPRMAWRDGEQETWAYDWMAFPLGEIHEHLPLAEKGEAPPEFYISAPAEVVRPLLARWKAESAWFYLRNPYVIVGKYELDALPPMLRLARRKPAVGAALLMPYLAQEVAELMAEWLTRSRQFRPVAQEWFARHGADGAALLIPAAIGAPPAQARTAALALVRLDAGDVLAAAGKLGCREAVQALLAGDPLDLVPAKIPAVPAWADPELLPQVLLSGRADALPSRATAALLRMTAMSQLDAPYEGLRVIADHCDHGSLSDFAWSLCRLWEAEGRPSSQAWAMDALGYFGDDTVADRLAPMVRAWPSEGSVPRAKRGADVLAAMGTDRALGHLSALARNAKSTPLRTHAAAALDRVAADRGLLPEQLDDLLAPDLGLDGDPVEYRGISYLVDLGAEGDLILRDPSGQQLAKLPRPADDDEKSVVSAWNSRRRKAKAVIGDQTARLEEAMVVQRRWALADFRSRIAAHPLVGRLARRLVWALDNRPVGLDRLGDLVDSAGGLAGEGEWVRLAHPAVDDFTPWLSWLARIDAPQPFTQAGREVFGDEDPSAYWQRTVEAAALYRLLRHGWHWGPAGRQARREQVFRPFGAEGRVVLTIDPGVSAVYDPKEEPEQTIVELTFESSRGELGVFSDLPLVARSELTRSLRALV
jgi:hypothetical protein